MADNDTPIDLEAGAVLCQFPRPRRANVLRGTYHRPASLDGIDKLCADFNFRTGSFVVHETTRARLRGMAPSYELRVADAAHEPERMLRRVAARALRHMHDVERPFTLNRHIQRHRDCWTWRCVVIAWRHGRARDASSREAAAHCDTAR
jgi:hypothetical protein